MDNGFFMIISRVAHVANGVLNVAVNYILREKKNGNSKFNPKEKCLFILFYFFLLRENPKQH